MKNRSEKDSFGLSENLLKIPLFLELLFFWIMVYNFDEFPIREELLEHVRERENSDLPLRTFRVVSFLGQEAADKIIIRSKTHLGAAIALYDHSTMNKLFSGNPWSFINGLTIEDGYRFYDFTDIKVKEAIVIEASSIGGDDTYLVEIDENDLVETDDLVNLSLFPLNVKPVR